MPEEVSVAEKSSNQVDNQNSGEIEVSLKVKGLEKENTPKSVYYAVALLLIWYAVFHDPVGFGITYTDIAGIDCDYDTSGDAIVDDLVEDLSKSCWEWKNEATAVVLIAFAGAAFCVWKANNPSKKEDLGETTNEQLPEKKEEQEEIVLSPLEEQEEILTRLEKSRNMLILAVAMIPIVLILWSQTQVDKHPDAAWSGLGDEHTPLILNPLEALDVNNCVDEILGTGLYQDVRIYCQELADSTEQKLTTFVILGVISALFLNHKIKKKNEEIAQMQDSILEMEEE